MKPTEDYLTKREKAELTQIIGEAMQLISKQFADLQLAIDKLDYRLNATVGQVDGHEVRLRRLEA